MRLPTHAMNLFRSYSTLESRVRQNIFPLLSTQLKIVMLNGHTQFLKECIHNTTYPKHITNKIHINDGMSENPKVMRKANSLAKEMCNHELHTLKTEMQHINRARGYCWRNLQGVCTTALFTEICTRIQESMTRTSKDLRWRHAHKWNNISDISYQPEMEVYDVDINPVLPYDLTNNRQEVIFHHQKHPSHITLDEGNGVKFTNATNIELPNYVIDVVNKGPNYCVTPSINKHFWEGLHLGIYRGFFGFRWREVINLQSNENASNLIIPFVRNRVTLPKACSTEIESRLTALRLRIINIYTTETNLLRKSVAYKLTQQGINESKQFLLSNNLSLVPSDKTKRIVICETESYGNKVNEILQNTDNYTPLPIAHSKGIENQANNILSGLKQNICLKKADLEKLIADGSKPAIMRCAIKDHKDKVNGEYPFRPIASIHGTPVDKLDWLASYSLSQLLRFVPSHLNNAVQLLDSCKQKAIKSTDSHFISLDVINLYPSIPLNFGIDCCTAFLRDHFDEIDTLNLSISQLNNILTFICFNYEIMFQGVIVKQARGVPMGARFAPPFAIITLHYIETAALNKLTTIIEPAIYYRYIDDVILGPVPCDNNIHNNILEVFNSINGDIQFTIEAPNQSEWLPFLDTKLRYVNNNLEFACHIKPFHSNNALHANSHHSDNIKKNFLFNEYKRIKDRCSDHNIKTGCFKEAHTKFAQLGYKPRDIRNASRKADHWQPHSRRPLYPGTNAAILKLPFINAKACRTVETEARRLGLNFHFIFRPGNNIIRALNTPKMTQIQCRDPDSCPICTYIHRYKCSDKNLVYAFNCSICHQEYIGYSARPILQRYNEHARSVRNRDDVSALSHHLLTQHSAASHNISTYNMTILRRCSDAVNANITESMLIQKRLPKINRKHEKAGLL